MGASRHAKQAVTTRSIQPFRKAKALFDLKSLYRTYIKPVLKAPKAWYKRRKWLQRLQGTPEERFTRIYESRAWSSKESLSGTGSEYHYTAKLRAAMPGLFETFGIRTFLDAPCGDFNWMRHVVAQTHINYIGGDIVKSLIADNNRQYGADNVTFLHLDITTGELPKADMMMVRDCLFHLSYADNLAFLDNFVASGIPYLFTTTHKPRADFSNRDITTGDFRFIDLFSPPFLFPATPRFRVDDFPDGHHPREMCLFDREQVAAVAQAMRQRLSMPDR